MGVSRKKRGFAEQNRNSPTGKNAGKKSRGGWPRETGKSLRKGRSGILCRGQKKTSEQSELCSDVARQEGLEPPTFWFVAKHSIQLSYWRIYSLVASLSEGYYSRL